MAGPGAGEAARGQGHLRASRADREQVIGIIKAAFAQGVLARDEFELRAGQAMAPRTYAELAALTADLPATRPARAHDEPMRHPGRLMAVATALYAGAWAYELFLSPHGLAHGTPLGFPHGGGNPAAPLLIFGSLSVYLSVLLIGIANIAALRRPKHRENRENRQHRQLRSGRPARAGPRAGPDPDTRSSAGYQPG